MLAKFLNLDGAELNMESPIKQLHGINDYQIWSYSILNQLKAINPKYEPYLNGSLSEEELRTFHEEDTIVNLIRSSISQEMHEKAQIYEKSAKEIWEYFKKLNLEFKRAHFLYMKDIVKTLSSTWITSQAKLDRLLEMGDNIFDVLNMDIGKEFVLYLGDSVAVTAYNMLVNSDLPTTLTNLKDQMIILRHISDAESHGRCAKCRDSHHNFLQCQSDSWKTIDDVLLPNPPSTNFSFRPSRNL